MTSKRLAENRANSSYLQFLYSEIQPILDIWKKKKKSRKFQKAKPEFATGWKQFA